MVSDGKQAHQRVSGNEFLSLLTKFSLFCDTFRVVTARSVVRGKTNNRLGNKSIFKVINF